MSTKTRRIAAFVILLVVIAVFRLPLFQSMNLALLTGFNLDKRLAVHRVNTLKKLSRVGDLSLGSIEIDIIYRPAKNDFEVAHDNESSKGLLLAEYLREIPDSIEKLWLDVKNVNDENIEVVTSSIKASFGSFNIQSLIFETSFNSPLLAYAHDEGLYTSFYLPTQRLLEVQRSGNIAEQLRVAKLLAKEVHSLKVRAVSFDLRLFPFVKKFLEPQFEKPLDLHIWTVKNLNRSYFLPQLFMRDYFWDENVKTILFKLTD